MPSVASVLKELLRLYDWRFFLVEREKDPRQNDIEFKRLLNKYGREKKAAWETARRILEKDMATPTVADLLFKLSMLRTAQLVIDKTIRAHEELLGHEAPEVLEAMHLPFSIPKASK